MKSVVALIFLGVVALSYAGLVSYNAAAVPTFVGHPYAAVPYSPYLTGYTGNYKLTLDTSLPGSAYASYPYAAAPTAYGYGVTKIL